MKTVTQNPSNEPRITLVGGEATRSIPLPMINDSTGIPNPYDHIL
jgi:hypothetical protein